MSKHLQLALLIYFGIFYLASCLVNLALASSRRRHQPSLDHMIPAATANTGGVTSTVGFAPFLEKAMPTRVVNAATREPHSAARAPAARAEQRHRLHPVQ